MPSPIFVIGIQRSGTTGLGNQIAQHSKIAAVMNKWTGTHESVYFSHLYGRYGDLSNMSNYIEFVAVMAENDYFILAGMDKETLYGMWPTTYEAVFQKVMEAYATQQNAEFWLARDPHHTPLAEAISNFFPDAKFVYIERDVKEIIRSHIKMSRRTLSDRFAKNRLKRFYFIVRTVYRWTRYKMVVGQFRRKSDRILCVKFHDYVASTETVLGQVCTFLTIEFEPTMLEAPVARNTSFKVNEQERTTILDKGDDFFINIIYWLIGTMMPVTYRLFPKFKLGYAKSASLPHWFFKMFDRLPQIDEEGS